MRYILFLLIALFSSWTIQKVQAFTPLLPEIPVEFQGQWATPDCGHYSEAVILTGHFYLKSSNLGMDMLPVALAGKGDDYLILQFGGQSLPVRRTEDGILKIGIYEDGKFSRAENWDDLQYDALNEYTNCADTPKIIPQMMERLMRYIDRIETQCSISVSNDCARVMFKMADVNADQKITPSEIKRAVATAMLFAELAEHKTLDTKNIESTAQKAQEESDKISQAIMAAQDMDGSGALDYNEMVENFVAPPVPSIKETLQKSARLLPAFGVVAMGLK